MVRLQKFLAQCGIASRRKSEELIVAGKVRVNGEVITELGTSIDPSRDRIQVRNKSITVAPRGVLLLYKPRGVVSTMSDPEGRPSIADYLTKHHKSYFPVGRLDWESSGLMILTNDGELAERLMHPRYGLSRTYLARVEGSITQATIQKLDKGVRLVDGMASAKVRLIEPPRDVRRKGAREPETASSWLEISVEEGRNRLVRRMMDKVGHSVIKLRRTAHGPFKLGKLRPGQIRVLPQDEYEKLRRAVVKERADD